MTEGRLSHDPRFRSIPSGLSPEAAQRRVLSVHRLLRAAAELADAQGRLDVELEEATAIGVPRATIRVALQRAAARPRPL